MSGTQHPANFQVLAKIQLFGGGGGGGLLQMLEVDRIWQKYPK